MRELNALIYNTIREDGHWKDLTGATATDPRIYKGRTPVKLTIDDSKQAYGVYYQMGSSKPYIMISPIQKNNYSFVIEVYGVSAEIVSEICYRLEKLFAEKRFTTMSFIVNYTFANRGSFSFDDARQLYFETVTINLNSILALSEAS